jgi:hypothetical protein
MAALHEKGDETYFEGLGGLSARPLYRLTPAIGEAFQLGDPGDEARRALCRKRLHKSDSSSAALLVASDID